MKLLDPKTSNKILSVSKYNMVPPHELLNSIITATIHEGFHIPKKDTQKMAHIDENLLKNWYQYKCTTAIDLNDIIRGTIYNQHVNDVVKRAENNPQWK